MQEDIINLKNRKFKCILVYDKSTLWAHQKPIMQLFSNVFKRDLSLEHWRWLYIDNVYGPPIVSLCYDKNILIGHNAVLTLFLKGAHGMVKTALTCTTMVRENYRSYGIYYILTQLMLCKIRNEKYDLIMGFPNQKAATLAEGYFDYHLERSHIAKLTKKQIYDLLPCYKDALRLDFSDPSYKTWRLSKPGIKYFYQGENILKYYGDDLELVYFTEDSVEALDDKVLYKVIVDEQNESLDTSKLFDYFFDYKIFNSALVFSNIKKELLMSDIF